MRRTRMELWLLVAAWGNARALELAGKLGDLETVKRIAAATGVMLGGARRIGAKELGRAYDATGLDVRVSIPDLLEKHGVDDRAFKMFVHEAGSTAVRAGESIGLSSDTGMVTTAFARGVMVGLELARGTDS